MAFAPSVLITTLRWIDSYAWPRVGFQVKNSGCCVTQVRFATLSCGGPDPDKGVDGPSCAIQTGELQIGSIRMQKGLPTDHFWIKTAHFRITLKRVSSVSEAKKLHNGL